MDAARPRNRVAPSHATGDGVIGGLPSSRARLDRDRDRGAAAGSGAGGGGAAAGAGGHGGGRRGGRCRLLGFGAGTFAGLPGRTG
jgi:hypothetical protein